jgi:DNA-directed RNA polymerase sigma subunit (sigma70/sigma32)
VKSRRPSNGELRTFAEIARELHRRTGQRITPARVRQICAEALEKIRKRLKNGVSDEHRREMEW